MSWNTESRQGYLYYLPPTMTETVLPLSRFHWVLLSAKGRFLLISLTTNGCEPERAMTCSRVEICLSIRGRYSLKLHIHFQLQVEELQIKYSDLLHSA